MFPDAPDRRHILASLKSWPTSLPALLPGVAHSTLVTSPGLVTGFLLSAKSCWIPWNIIFHWSLCFICHNWDYTTNNVVLEFRLKRTVVGLHFSMQSVTRDSCFEGLWALSSQTISTRVTFGQYMRYILPCWAWWLGGVFGHIRSRCTWKK